MASEAERSSRLRADYLPSLCAMKPAYSVNVVSCIRLLLSNTTAAR